MGDQFYVILPSNSSMDIYPDNKISNFKVHLANPLKLDSTKWEVGLSEIQFPHLWYNIREGKNTIEKEIHNLTLEEINYLYPIDDTADVTTETAKRIKLLSEKPDGVDITFRANITIPSGYYSSIEKLLEKLEEQDRRSIRPIAFKYEELSRCINVNIPKQCKLFFHDSDIAKCLGFKAQRIVEEGDKKSDVMSSIETNKVVYIYTDIIQNQHVGQFKVPLLRVIPVTSKYGEISCMQYDRPHFIPLSQADIHTIEINIKDDTGQFISFEAGRVLVTLVFRRKSAKFYND